ncbi:MAG: response regulator transcription factor, partial [Kiritimatiellia bacterium]
GDEAMKAVREHNPDILLLDIRMPGRDGLSALDEILAAFPKLKVLMLSTSDAEEDIFRSIEA